MNVFCEEENIQTMQKTGGNIKYEKSVKIFKKYQNLYFKLKKR